MKRRSLFILLIPAFGFVSSPAVADGQVYFGGLDGRFYAVSK
jgi:outer membrane protein assembly factor BamB